mmetsp:Transcript_37426/g.93906  ORF Transcript_37426/g.93906 Transcript_37426/m.93906 type:complete len:92 (-) Transcript_37426:1469-1744(-)
MMKMRRTMLTTAVATMMMTTMMTTTTMMTMETTMLVTEDVHLEGREEADPEGQETSAALQSNAITAEVCVGGVLSWILLRVWVLLVWVPWC